MKRRQSLYRDWIREAYRTLCALTLASVGIAFLLGVASADEEEVRTWLVRAEQLWERGDGTQARALYEKVAARNTGTLGRRARERLVEICRRAGEVDTELRLISELVEIDPRRWIREGEKRRGDIFHARKKYLKAKVAYQAALKVAIEEKISDQRVWKGAAVRLFTCLDVALFRTKSAEDRKALAQELVEWSNLLPGLRTGDLLARDRLLAGHVGFWNTFESHANPRWIPELQIMHTLNRFRVPAYSGRRWLLPRKLEEGLACPVDETDENRRNRAKECLRTFLGKPDFAPVQFIDPMQRLSHLGLKSNGRPIQFPKQNLLSSNHPLKVIELHTKKSYLWVARLHLAEILLREGNPEDAAKELARVWGEARRSRSLLLLLMPIARLAGEVASRWDPEERPDLGRGVQDLFEFYVPTS